MSQFNLEERMIYFFALIRAPDNDDEPIWESGAIRDNSLLYWEIVNGDAIPERPDPSARRLEQG